MRITTTSFCVGRMSAIRFIARRAVFTSLALLPLLLVACGGGDDISTPAPAQLTSITVSSAGANLIVGQTQTNTAAAKDQNGQPMAGVAFTWASSNPAVASVTSGVVTGVSAGSADITATSGGITSNAARVTVIVVAVGSVVIDKPSVFLTASGQSAQLSGQTFDPQGAPSAGTVELDFQRTRQGLGRRCRPVGGPGDRLGADLRSVRRGPIGAHTGDRR